MNLSKMIFVASLILMAVTVSAKTNSKQLKRDFDFICKAQKDFLTKMQSKEADKVELVVQRSEAIEKSIKTIEAKNTISAIAHADPAKKRRLIELSAADSGLKNWSCPELDSW